ncbi:MAG: polyprenol monophosphomannose synthase [Chloroflexi bacterium]|jgi:dolichol-phosphate mannosyltransferase|nr:polyprenol monophosphomannose synthase [Chloroflexota bacterium]
MHLAVVIPTYNEAENLPGLLSALFSLPLHLSVLVIDDNSPDGTGELAESLTSRYPGLHVLHRSQKQGLGTAYLEGFRHVLEWGAEAIGQMDADFSHDPQALIAMAKELEQCDLVLGSRYVPGGAVDERWAFWRKSLSRFGNFYARTILGLPLRDVTTGYRLWRSQTLQGMPLERVRSNGYVFQVEMAYLAYRLGYRIREVPIYFLDRQGGQSKMSFRIQLEAALRVWQVKRAYRDLRPHS